MRLQKYIFLVVAIIIIIGSFYLFFVQDFKNIPTVLKIVVDKQEDKNNPFFEEIRKEFIQKNKNISIKWIYLNDYDSTEYISKNDVDGWFASSESSIEHLKSSYDFSKKSNVSLQPITYATSPMVIIGWKEKLDKLGDINIEKLYDIVTNNKSWSSVGGDYKWGKIKFTHADPTIYDTGNRLMVLLTNNYNIQKGTPKKFITKYDIVNAKDYILSFENKIKYQPSDRNYIIDEMVNYEFDNNDMMLFDEFTVLKNIQNAKTKWSNLKIIYPTPNINVNVPFVIINASNYSAQKVDSMNKFKDFLLSEDVQKRILKTGFRPVKTNVKELELLEREYSNFGFKKDISDSGISFESNVLWSISDIFSKQ